MSGDEVDITGFELCFFIRISIAADIASITGRMGNDTIEAVMWCLVMRVKQGWKAAVIAVVDIDSEVTAGIKKMFSPNHTNSLLPEKYKISTR